jgi:hypothetical protein
MFCPACGATVLEGADYCFRCGRSVSMLKARGQTENTTPQTASSSSLTANAVSVEGNLSPEIARLRQERPDLIGIGGWLLTFCIICSITTPLAALIAMVAWPSPLYILICGGLGTYSCAIGITMWRMKPGALKNAKTFVIVIAVSNGVLAIINGVNSEQSALGSALAGIVVAGAWLVYFDESKRVKATFGDPNFSGPISRPDQGDVQSPVPPQDAVKVERPPISDSGTSAVTEEICSTRNR